MGFDKLFHRVFLSATATIAFAVIVAVGYLATNEKFGLATDSTSCGTGYYWDGSTCVPNTTTTTTCDWSTHYLKTSTNTCQPKTNCYDTANPEYNTVECQGVRSTNTTSSTTCGTGYYWNGTSCVASGTTTCSSGQYWNGSACVDSTSTVDQTTQTWNSLGLSSQIRTDADSTRITQLKQTCANVPIGADIWMPNAGTFSSVDFGMPDPAKCTLAAACTSTQYFNGTSCVTSSSGTSSSGSWVNKIWTFKDGTSNSYILNRTDSEYLNYITSIEAQCLLINKSQFTWKPNAGDDSATNWQNFGIPDCSASSTSNTSSCPSNIVTLLGNGCHTMSSAYFNSAMTNYVLFGASNVVSCATTYLSGCTVGGNTTTCSSGQYWNGSACVDSTSTVGQTTQTWNSLGLSSQIRTDADSTRITQLKQTCANVPIGANIWMPNAGTFSSVDFGMPDPAKCTLAAACTSTQYFNGTSCVTSSTTCPSGSTWSGTACVSNTASCQSGYAWDGTACIANTIDTTTSSSCPATITPLLGSGCHNMGNAYFNGAMDKYVLLSTSTVKACSSEPITNCAGQSLWSTPTGWKEMIWNNLGLRSYISINAPPSIVDAAKAACANTKPDQVTWPNPSDFSKPESAGIPDCSQSTTVIIYPFKFPNSGKICSSYQDCYNYCKTTPGSGTGDPATCDKYFPGATTVQETIIADGEIKGTVKDALDGLADDFFGFVYLESSAGQSKGTSVERGIFSLRAAPGSYRLVLESPSNSSWITTGAISVTVVSGQSANVTLLVKKNISKIWGFITDSANKPVTGAAARIFASGNNGVWRETTVDKTTGRYELTVISGTWYLGADVMDVSAGTSYFRPKANISINVAEGESVQKDIQLLPSEAVIYGAVKRPAGEPFPNAWVAVETIDSAVLSGETLVAKARFSTGARTDAFGQFSINVPPGNYSIKVYAVSEDGLINPEEISLTLAAGAKKEILLSFRSSNTIIKGTTYVGSSAKEAFVSAWSDRGGYVDTKSDSQGRYSLAISNRDTWRLAATAKYEDALYKSSTVALTPSTTGGIVQNLLLEKERELPSPVTATSNANMPNVVATEDGMRVSVPANSIAAAGRATVTISPAAELPEQDSAQVVGVGYEVKALNEQGQDVTKLNASITVTIPYDPIELKNKGISVKELKMAYWDTVAGVWQEIAASLVNEQEHLITATVNHLTRFAIIAAADITPPHMPTTPTASAKKSGVVLTWIDPSADFSHAKIYRSNNSGELGVVIATDLTDATYIDTAVVKDKTYYYTVRAVDLAGNESININQVSAKASTTTESSSLSEPAAASALAARLAGMILLQVEEKGEAWYVNPKNKQRYYLGRPADAFAIMRSLGLGITNADLSQIAVAKFGS